MIQAILKKLRALTPSLLLLSGTLIVAALLAEVAVRLVLPQQLILVRPDVWQPVDSLGWIKRPAIDTDINTGERTVRLVTDSLGFRVPAKRIEREQAPADAVRILLIGDSMMEALQVEYEQSLAGLLEAEVSARIGKPVEVWNTGVACWGPSQYLMIARRMLERERFDYVVVSLALVNDAILQHREYFPPRQATVVHHLRFPRSLSFAEWRNSVIYPINDFLERRSHLYIVFRRATEMVRAGMGLGGPEFPFEVRLQEAESPRWDVTADVTRDIAALAHAKGIPILFVLIPSNYQVDTTIFRQFARAFDLNPSEVDLEQPNKLLGERMRQRGLRVIDPLAAMREAHAAGTQLHGFVDPHLSPEGHELVSDLVTDAIADTGLAARQSAGQGTDERAGGRVGSRE